MLKSAYTEKDLRRVVRVEHHIGDGHPPRQFLVLVGADGVIKTKDGAECIDLFRPRIPEVLEYLRWLNNGSYPPLASDSQRTEARVFVFQPNPKRGKS